MINLSELSPILVYLIMLLFGIGFGICVQRAGLCFSHGLSEVYMGSSERISRMFFIIFLITSIGFMLSEYIYPDLGFVPVGQIRGYGFYNLLAGLIFGIGIILNGGCILGSLRQFGEGNLHFLLSIICFIPGMFLTVYIINPFLMKYYNIINFIIPEIMPIPPIIIILGFLLLIIPFLNIRK